MANKQWCQGISGLCCEVNLTMRVDIATGIVGEFITKYLTADGRHNILIGEVYINGNIQLLGLTEVQGISFTYVSNAAIPEYRGWGAGGWTGTYITNYTSKTNSPSSTGNRGKIIHYV